MLSRTREKVVMTQNAGRMTVAVGLDIWNDRMGGDLGGSGAYAVFAVRPEDRRVISEQPRPDRSRRLPGRA